MARSETIPMRVGAPPISPEDPGDASVFYKTAITVVLAFLYAAQSIVRSNDLLCSLPCVACADAALPAAAPRL